MWWRPARSKTPRCSGGDVAGTERAKKLAQSIPLGRLGKSEDVARAVSFFSSPDAGFITGQTLYVCGGASIGSISI